jgi:hypothetical protein
MKRPGKLLLGSAILGITTLGCEKKPEDTTPPPPATAGRPECPMDSLRLKAVRIVDRQPVSYTLTQIPISGSITNVPEYHDCQRFVVDSGQGPVYGPMVAIFAHHALDSLYDELADTSLGSASQAAAEIYSYDGDYEPLSIRRGFNCLYLIKQNNVWGAVMKWADQNAELCLEPLANGDQLTVRAEAFQDLEKNDLPPVARWDWDPDRNVQYISIRCGEEWCEVGPRGGFLSSRTLVGGVSLPRMDAVPALVGSVTGNERRRVLRVRGWYDEQVLALPATSGLAPSTIRGIAIPHPLLQQMTIASFATRWTLSGYIMLNGPPQDYSTKLGLGEGVNQISMCSGDWRDCPHRDDVPEPTCGAEADKKWWGEVTGPGGEKHYFCVTRRTHDPMIEIPGTMRWRWDPDDEKTWIRCPNGCCTVN